MIFSFSALYMSYYKMLLPLKKCPITGTAEDVINVIHRRIFPDDCERLIHSLLNEIRVKSVKENPDLAPYLPSQDQEDNEDEDKEEEEEEEDENVVCEVQIKQVPGYREDNGTLSQEERPLLLEDHPCMILFLFFLFFLWFFGFWFLVFGFWF